MQKIIYITIFTVTFVGVYRSLSHYYETHYKRNVSTDLRQTKILEKEKYKNKKAYIIDVINHGSSRLHFKKDEVMEGGFVSKEDASKVACYILSLSKTECAYPPEAEALFSSNCAGCHGNDGKGEGGVYPDLTREPLLGLEEK